MMAHKFRAGDRVQLIKGVSWSPATQPRKGDFGTYLGLGPYSSRLFRVLYDRPETRKPLGVRGTFELDITDITLCKDRQTWGTPPDAVKYIGMRVNPAKV